MRFGTTDCGLFVRGEHARVIHPIGASWIARQWRCKSWTCCIRDVAVWTYNRRRRSSIATGCKVLFLEVATNPSCKGHAERWDAIFLHRWPPPEVFEDAIEWMQLKAMQSGSLAHDGHFLESLYRRREAEASDAEKRSDAIAELNAYRSLVSDFSGLEEVSEYEKKLIALTSSPSLKEALKKEQGQITTHAELTRLRRS